MDVMDATRRTHIKKIASLKLQRRELRTLVSGLKASVRIVLEHSVSAQKSQQKSPQKSLQKSPQKLLQRSPQKTQQVAKDVLVIQQPQDFGLTWTTPNSLKLTPTKPTLASTTSPTTTKITVESPLKHNNNSNSHHSHSIKASRSPSKRGLRGSTGGDGRVLQGKELRFSVDGNDQAIKIHGSPILLKSFRLSHGHAGPTLLSPRRPTPSNTLAPPSPSLQTIVVSITDSQADYSEYNSCTDHDNDSESNDDDSDCRYDT